MKEKTKPTVRLDPDLHKEAKVLIGFYGHLSVENVVNRALQEYLCLYKKEIKQIKESK